MPRRKEYRQMVRELADCIATILMYAGDPIAPSKMRVFNMDPALYEWVQAHATRALDFLDWRRKMFPTMPTALPEGEPRGTDEVECRVSGEPQGGA